MTAKNDWETAKADYAAVVQKIEAAHRMACAAYAAVHTNDKVTRATRNIAIDAYDATMLELRTARKAAYTAYMQAMDVYNRAKGN